MDQEVRHWFQQAVDVPASRRLAFLAENCPSATVRSEVASLLDYDLDTRDPAEDVRIPTVVTDSIGQLLCGAVEGGPAPRVGPFALGRLLGSGGMGLVYEGSRVDGNVEQRVAIKFAQVSPSASDSFRDTVHRRFYRERQILANLRHPYIAGLIDAGATAEGVPYAVIEQVDGAPIDEYCERELPSRVDRIQLVLKLCDAVQFAHSQLIVHADIKPDNVLVTAGGIPKLIDFGVASDLGDDATLTAMRAFTPGYASPEQSRGEPATVATDVYGLGAVLYRLLTGTKPRAMENAPLEQILRAIREQDVARPSTAKPDLKGDLENILLKALDRDPRRRYGTVAELSDDLQRYLACRPVRATPASAGYRARRFVRRHWVTVAALTVLFAAISAIAGLAVRERQQAIRRAAETRRLAQSLLFDVHDEISGLAGGAKAREKLGALAVHYLENLERSDRTDPELKWDLLNAYARLAQSRGGSASSVGDTPGGLELARKALELGASVELIELDAQRRDRLFGIYEGLNSIFEEAERNSERRDALDRMRRLAQDLSPVRNAEAARQWARYFDSQGNAAEAVAAFEEAIAVLRPAVEGQGRTARLEADLSAALVGLGRSQAALGNFSAAVRAIEEAISRTEASNAVDPHSVRGSRQLYWSHIVLGDVLGLPLRFNLGRPLQAVEHYEKARAIAARSLAVDPANDMAKIDLSRVLGRAGATLASVDPQRAMEYFEQADAMAQQASPRNHAGLDYRYASVTAAVTALVRLRQYDRAQRNIAEARRLHAAMREAGMNVDDKSILRAEAVLLYAQGRPKQALDAAARHLTLVPDKASTVLSENFDAIEVLERMRIYADKAPDPALGALASARLEKIWQRLNAAHPRIDLPALARR